MMELAAKPRTGLSPGGVLNGGTLVGLLEVGLQAAPTSWWPSSPGQKPAVCASLALLVVQVSLLPACNRFRNPSGRALGDFALYPTWTLAVPSVFAQL